MTVEPLVDTVNHFDGNLRIKEVGRANLYGTGASHDKLQGIPCAAYAAQTYDGDAYGSGHRIYHTQGYGFDAGTAQTSRTDREHTLALLDVDSRAHERVYETHGVCALSLDGLGNRADVGDVGREFHYQRLGVSLADSLDHTRSAFGADAKSHASVVYVGAGYVELISVSIRRILG